MKNLLKLFAFALALALLLGLTAGVAATEPSGETHNGYLVVLRDADPDTVRLAAAAPELALTPVVESVGLYRADTLEETSAYVHAGLVEGIYPNYYVELAALPNDTGYTGGLQGYADIVGMPYIWNNLPALTGAGVRVAVIDSGVDNSHPDFQRSGGGSCVVAGKNYAADGQTAYTDIANHATRVAGIISATANNALGIAGFAPETEIVSLKIFYMVGDKATAETAHVLEAIYDAVDVYDCQVLNMSFRFYTDNDMPFALLTAALEHAVASGALLVAAAGNDGTVTTVGQSGVPAQYRPSYPAAEPMVLSVGATNDNGTVANLSQRHPSTNISAPGISIYSTDRTGGYGAQSGTSFSAPQAAAAAALMKQQYPDITQAQFQAIVTSSAAPLTPGGTYNSYGGAGVLDFANLFRPLCFLDTPVAVQDGWQVTANYWCVADGNARLVAAGYDADNHMVESHTVQKSVPANGTFTHDVVFTSEAVTTVRFFLLKGTSYVPISPPAACTLPSD